MRHCASHVRAATSRTKRGGTAPARLAGRHTLSTKGGIHGCHTAIKQSESSVFCGGRRTRCTRHCSRRTCALRAGCASALAHPFYCGDCGLATHSLPFLWMKSCAQRGGARRGARRVRAGAHARTRTKSTRAKKPSARARLGLHDLLARHHILHALLRGVEVLHDLRRRRARRQCCERANRKPRRRTRNEARVRAPRASCAAWRSPPSGTAARACTRQAPAPGAAGGAARGARSSFLAACARAHAKKRLVSTARARTV
jgi:hypothetical protein